MTQKKNEPFDPKKVTCTIDDVEVDCETWGGSMTEQEKAEMLYQEWMDNVTSGDYQNYYKEQYG